MPTLNYNPDIPVYAAPETTFENVQAQPASTTVNDNATVENRLTGLLSSGSKYIQANEASSLRKSSARGLLNSSIAAGEGQKAAIESALPIAQQDAKLFGDMALQNNKAENDSSLNNQVAALEFQKTNNNAAITGALTTQESKKAFELQRLADTAQMQRIEVDNIFKQQLQTQSLDASNRQALISSLSAMGQETVGSIERILRDTNIEADAKQSAIDAVMSNYRANVTTAGAIAGLNLVWS